MRELCPIVLWLVATASAAQEQGLMMSMQRTFELPAHRSLMAVISDTDTRLSEFETDGCSGGMSWSWRVVSDIFPDFKTAQGAQPPWEACCVIHDIAYHEAGGAEDADASFAARLTADETLRNCVANPSEREINAMAARYEVAPEQVAFAYGLIADSMYNAVRFGGAPCSGLPWRWGFGYPGCVAGF